MVTTKSKFQRGLVYVFLFISLLTGCSDYDGNHLLEINLKTRDGGNIYKMYKRKVLIDSFYTYSGKIEGVRFSVDTIDSVKIYSTYKNGKRNGEQFAYFLDNILANKVNFRNDTMIGECLFYYPNGVLRAYEFRRPIDGKIKYQRFYNEKGEMVKSVGEGLIQFTIKNKVKVGEEVVGEAVLATPPKATSVFMYADYVNDSTAKNHVINTNNLQKKHYVEVFKKPGVYKKVIYWSIEDSLTGHIHKGSKVLPIVVKQ